MFTYSQWLVDFLAKAAGHKYIKRIPYMSGGKTRYRYIYKVTHMAGGKHVLDPEHMVVNAAFMLSSAKGSEVHAHIAKVDGDMVTYRLDDGPDKGKLVTESKSKLAERLNAEHGVHEALATEREKQAKVVADLRAGGASEKQVAREQARLDRLSASVPALKPVEPKPATPKARTSKEPKPTRSVAELEELRAKVFGLEDLSQVSDDELKDVVKFTKKRQAETKDDARGHLALIKELHRAERRRERARSDEEYERADAEASNLMDQIEDDEEGTRAYNGYSEYEDSERKARQELDRRKAASAN